MPFTVPLRSAADATRFTSTVPHASRRAAGPGSSATPAASRFQSPGSNGGAPGGARPPPPSFPGETPEQKVARLRAAHMAAKNAQVSRFDRIVHSARHMFDSAHRITIVGLIGFTAIAGLLTVYTTVDMMRFNHKRKLEFIAAQKQMEDDSLAAARLAYMRGDATEEQTALVEEVAAAERAAINAGAPPPARSGDGFFKMPSLLGAPSPVAAESAPTAAAPATPSSWAKSMLSREEQGEIPGSSQSRLGYESLSEEDDWPGARESDVVRAVEEHSAYLAGKAQAALDRERANQRNGGPLDRLGLEPAAAAGKKSWWKFW
ncbi:hypothetical protein CMQ_2115 [Grosmannia clavigera kw1407]|uniref:Cytochrome oxidase c assembly-domain-containing protein n=1 Tax=Grosmannia clavigera (strain kw1407 / UAMH 11150) TaxID=655863 RepID=F0XJD6_GROCL|nr:uncharacterized protein CMQ_2115 [Grosmannia clavigera kw1407]EFX02066.1 hypothetical protein CMQ_2115 [Grosmannia clavigera kw1407]